MTRLRRSALSAFLLTLTTAVPATAQDSTVSKRYEDHADQFTLTLPPGWTAFDQNAVLLHRPGPYGVIGFAAKDLANATVGDQIQNMRDTDTGAIPSFFVDRQPAPKKTSCQQFPPKAQAEVLKLVKERGKVTEVEPLKAEDALVGGCQGVRIRGRVRVGTGAEWVSDIHAVSDGQVLYLFALRHLAEYADQSRPGYEAALGTLQMTRTQ
jgi:hypothetical protein